MPKILITGNGFDLHHHLPTKYQDFLECVKNIEEVNAEKLIPFNILFKNRENNDDLDYFEIEKMFLEDIDLINSIKQKLSQNVWYNYFRDELNIESWIDFETKIEEAIKYVIFYIKKYREKVNIKPPNSILSCPANYFDNNIHCIFTLENLKIVKTNKFYSSFYENFLIKKHSRYIDVDENEVLKHLKSQLDDFIIIFNFYFEKIINPFYKYSKLSTKSNLLSSINYFYTFNYTSTIKHLYNVKKECFHIHGKSYNPSDFTDNKKPNIVLGFEDVDSEIDNKKFYLPFTKYYQKLNNNTDFRFIKELSDEFNDCSWYIYIWGHSLDKSDKDYVDEIFDFLLEEQINSDFERKCFIIYHNDLSKSNMLLNLLNIRGRKDVEECMRSNKIEFIKSDYKNLENIFQIKEKIKTFGDPEVI